MAFDVDEFIRNYLDVSFGINRAVNGLNKAIYKHDVPRNEVTKIPQYIKNKPVEVSPRMQDAYVFEGTDGNYRIVTSPTKSGRTVTSIYKIER